MGASFKFKCGCGKSLAADASMAGKRAKCPNCGKVLQIPAPPPKSSDDELEMLPLVDSPVKPKPAAPSPPRQNPSAPAAGQPARRPNPAPQSQAAAVSSSAPAAGGKSIWDEVDEDDFRLQAAAVATSTPCPKCGTSMSSQAVLCIACGYNKQTGVSATTQLAPRPSKKSGSSWFKRREKSPEEQSWRVPIGLLVAGIVVLVMGIKEKTLADASSQQPETLSLQQLIARGADGNPNIILTDYQICDGCVYEGRGKAGAVIGDWKKAWVPIVNRGEDPFNTTNPQALIYSERVKNIQDCLPVLQHPQLRGMVTNRITSLGSKEKDLLRQTYRSIDFDRCLIFHEGREPKSSETIMLMLLGGGVLTAAGGLLMLKNFV